MEAARAEAEFAHYSSRYHIARVRRRLLITSLCLTLSCVEPLASSMREPQLADYSLLPLSSPGVPWEIDTGASITVKEALVGGVVALISSYG